MSDTNEQKEEREILCHDGNITYFDLTNSYMLYSFIKDIKLYTFVSLMLLYITQDAIKNYSMENVISLTILKTFLQSIYLATSVPNSMRLLFF